MRQGWLDQVLRAAEGEAGAGTAMDDGSHPIIPKDNDEPTGTPAPKEPEEEPSAEEVAAAAAAASAEGGKKEDEEEERVPARRVAELTAEKWAERREREAAEARAALAEEQLRQFRAIAAGEDPAAASAVEGKTVEQRARELATQEAANMRFNDQCNEAAVRGKAVHADFDAALGSLQKLSGGQLPRGLVEIALETGKPEEVIYALGKDPERADRVLRMGPVAQAMELTRLVDTLEKKPGVEVSNAGKPIRAVVGSGGNTPKKTLDTPNLPIDEWLALREQEVVEENKKRATVGGR